MLDFVKLTRRQGCTMFTVNDDAVGPHLPRRGASADHERLVLEARDVDRRGRTAEADGEMLVCVSRATGGRVMIDA
jgi:hypothetical protein